MTGIEAFPLGMLQANCYLVYSKSTKDAVLIDPSGDGNNVVNRIKELALNLLQLITTHTHFDHIGGTNFFKQAFPNVKISCHEADVVVWKGNKMLMKMLSCPENMFNYPDAPDETFSSDSVITVGDIKLNVIPTPGHTPGGVCFYDESGKILVTGDTLFAGGIGRTDFPGGNWQHLK